MTHLLFALVLVLANPPAADPAADEALLLAQDPKGDAARQLEKADELVRARPDGPRRHYLRGFVLHRLRRTADALEAYKKAATLAPGFAEAHYNVGVASAELGKDDDALVAWDKAIAADARHVDAQYNAGQLHYNRRQFERALTRWQAARRIAPNDFAVSKKVVQALYALDRLDEARKVQADIADLWKKSSDPRVKHLTDYVFDQFDVGKHRVFAFAILKQKDESNEIVYSFRVSDGDQLIGLRAELETSPVARDAGTPYVLSFSHGPSHATVHTVARMPAYPQLRATVTRLVSQALAGKKLEP